MDIFLEIRSNCSGFYKNLKHLENVTCFQKFELFLKKINPTERIQKHLKSF